MTAVSTRALPRAALTTLVREIAADEGLWRPSLVIPEGGKREWTRLSADADVDVWLLSWLPGHATELHDHGRSAAVFGVVDGLLTEWRLEAPGRRSEFRRSPGSAVWVPPGVIHDVHGAGDGPAVSVHAYSPPLRGMTFYDAAGHALRTVETATPEEGPDR
jgi:mannose-6-phosphate isomerase-like protein (cupin superfamily)